MSPAFAGTLERTAVHKAQTYLRINSQRWAHSLFCTSLVPSRPLAPGPTKWWTPASTNTSHHTTAWRGVTAYLVTPQRNLGPGHTILNRQDMTYWQSPSLLKWMSTWLTQVSKIPHFGFCTNSLCSLPRWRSQESKLRASPSESVILSTLHLSLWKWLIRKIHQPSLIL